jgi:hypothetical protein
LMPTRPRSTSKLGLPRRRRIAQRIQSRTIWARKALRRIPVARRLAWQDLRSPTNSTMNSPSPANEWRAWSSVESHKPTVEGTYLRGGRPRHGHASHRDVRSVRKMP